MTSMRAVVNRAAGRYDVVTLPLPRPGSGQVLLRVRACGICGSDLHDAENFWGPRTPGHESAGTIEEVGAGVHSSRIGERAAIDPILRCGSCGPCREGRDNLCDRFQVIGCGGDAPVPGGFAEFLVAPAGNAIPIGSSVEFREATLTDSLAVDLHALELIESEMPRVRRCLVFGTGAVGLLLASLLRELDRDVWVTSRSPNRRERLAAGGWNAIDPSNESELRRLEGTFDLVADAAGGANRVVSRSLSLLRKGGTLLTLAQHPPYELDHGALLFREIRIQGVFGQTRACFSRAVARLGEGLARDIPLLQFPLDKFSDAMTAAREGAASKVVIVPPARTP